MEGQKCCQREGHRCDCMTPLLSNQNNTSLLTLTADALTFNRLCSIADPLRSDTCQLVINCPVEPLMSVIHCYISRQ